jgi:sensor histidine kinase YesM
MENIFKFSAGINQTENNTIWKESTIYRGYFLSIQQSVLHSWNVFIFSVKFSEWTEVTDLCLLVATKCVYGEVGSDFLSIIKAYKALQKLS